MKKIFTLLLLLCSFIGFSQSTTVVISQVYGGGGGSTGTYLHDYIELHNISNTTQSLTGFSLQYGSATGNFASTATNLYAFPAGTSMPAGSYLLIQLSAAGSSGAALPVTPDLVSTNLTMSGANGKVALASQATALGCGSTPCNIPSSTIIDLVGYGTGVNNSEGGTSVNNNVALTSTQGAVRKTNGCQDTDNNNNDFTVVTAPVPRNSASPVVNCSSAPAPSLIVTGSIAGFGNVTVGNSSASQTYSLSGTNLTGAPGVITVTSPIADFEVSNNNTTWSASTTIPYTSATLAATPVYVRFTPQSAGLKATNISNNGGGIATPVTVAVNGTGIAATTPTITASSLASFGNVCVNTTAGPNNFTINGSNLTTADVTVGPLAGYTFATTSGGTYTPSLTLTQPGGTFTQQVFVRFTPTAIQSYNGNIAVAGGGVTAAINVVATGSGDNSAPAVTTGAASAITINSATVAGSITSAGCTAVTAYGIEYSTTNGFPNNSGTKVASTNLSGTGYTSALAGLAANTLYYYKAYATNAGGTTYGAQQTFTTSAAVLTATPLTAFGALCVNTTGGPNSFTINSAGLGTANVTVAALAGYTYSTTSNGTYTPTLSIAQPGGPFTQIVFVKFTPAALQSYNGNIVVGGGGANSINVAASGSGANVTPGVTSAAATAVTTSTATLAGTIVSQGCSFTTTQGFEYSGINNFTPGSGTKAVVTSVDASGNYSTTLTGLAQNTTYYFRAYATSASGTGFSSMGSFTTTAIPDGLVLYSIPAQRGTSLRFSVSGIKPDHYAVVLFNSNGQKVFRKDMIVQTNFINDAFVVPGHLTPGLYQFQLENNNGYIKRKTIMIK